MKKLNLVLLFLTILLVSIKEEHLYKDRLCGRVFYHV